ncbi:MAG: hypothetical protein V4714_20900 [Bacteroidota bacterium]
MRVIPFLFSLLLLCSFDGPKLAKVTVAKGITVSMPANFTRMTDDEMANRYFTFRKPVAMFTSPDHSADLGFNISNSHWRKDDLPIAKDFYLSTIQTMYTKVDFIQKGVLKMVNKRQFAVFEFVSEVVDDDEQSLNKGAVTRQYSYIQYAIQDGKVLVFNFTCAARAKDKWQTTAQAVMKSVRLK